MIFKSLQFVSSRIHTTGECKELTEGLTEFQNLFPQTSIVGKQNFLKRMMMEEVMHKIFPVELVVVELVILF